MAPSTSAASGRARERGKRVGGSGGEARCKVDEMTRYGDARGKVEVWCMGRGGTGQNLTIKGTAGQDQVGGGGEGNEGGREMQV